VGLAACTVLTSETPLQLLADGQEPVGVLYSLPLSVIDLTLSADKDGKLTLQPSPARSIADPHHRYVLRYRPLPNYDDKVWITVNPSSLLKQAKADTVDQTPAIIVNFVKLFSKLSGGFEDGPVATGGMIAKVTVVPTDAEDLERGLVRLNQALIAYATSAGGKCEKIANTEYAKKALCLRNNKIVKNGETWLKYRENTRLEPNILRLAPVQFWIKRASVAQPYVDDKTFRRRPAAVPPAADCSVGICYRPPLPYHFAYSVGAEPAREFGARPGVEHRVEFMPNEAQMVEIDIRRTFFGRKMLDINFDETTGFLASVEVQKDAEIVAMAKLPVQILKAMLSVLQFRLKILTSEYNEAVAQKDLLDARRQLAQQQRQLESAIAQAEAEQGRAVSVSTVPVPQAARTSSGAGETVKLPE
jgi:hypothetical protein